jgi:hypothetical protein
VLPVSALRNVSLRHLRKVHDGISFSRCTH